MMKMVVRMEPLRIQTKTMMVSMTLWMIVLRVTSTGPRINRPLTMIKMVVKTALLKMTMMITMVSPMT